MRTNSRGVPRIGPKSIENLLRNVERSKRRGLARLLYGLGIRFVGTQTAQIFADDFGDVDAIAGATEEELQRSDGIGPEVARSVALFFKQQSNLAMIARLRDAGVEMTRSQAPARDRREARGEDVRAHRNAAGAHAATRPPL